MPSIEVTNPGDEATSLLECLRERIGAHDVVIEDGSTGVLSVTDEGTVDDLPSFLEQQLEACVTPDTEWSQYVAVRAD